MHFHVEKVGGDERRWLVRMVGPADTPYEQGVYGVLLEFPQDYPWSQPSVTFRTPIWHPNVCPQSGAVDARALIPCWRLNITPLHMLQRLVELMQWPYIEEEPDKHLKWYGQDQDSVVYQYCHKPALFQKVARRWNSKSFVWEPLLPQLCLKPRAQSVDLDESEMKLLIYHANQRCSASVSSRFLTTASPASQLLL